MCKNPENKTESWTGHPMKLLNPELATPKIGRVQNFGKFRGRKLLTIPFFGVGNSQVNKNLFFTKYFIINQV